LTIQVGLMFIICPVVLVAFIMQWFIQSPILSLFISILLVICFGIYIIWDTQMIVGGDRGFSLSTDDYILAAMMLYIDIVRLFIEILRIVGDR